MLSNFIQIFKTSSIKNLLSITRYCNSDSFTNLFICSYVKYNTLWTILLFSLTFELCLKSFI